MKSKLRVDQKRDTLVNKRVESNYVALRFPESVRALVAISPSLVACAVRISERRQGLRLESRIIHEAKSRPLAPFAYGAGVLPPGHPAAGDENGRAAVASRSGLRIPRGQYVRTISQKVGKAAMAGAVTRYEAQG